MATIDNSMQMTADGGLFGSITQGRNLLVSNGATVGYLQADGTLLYFDGSFGEAVTGQSIGFINKVVMFPLIPLTGLSLTNADIDYTMLKQVSENGDVFARDAYVLRGNDEMNLGGYSDFALGYDGNDTIRGGFGNDDINGNKGDDNVVGQTGNDMVRGGQGNDYVSGDDGNDIVNGNIGNDIVNGGDGADWVFGGQDDDQLYGGAGSDLLSGDKGNDTLYGAEGSNVFAFALESGYDLIADFVIGQDKLLISAALKSSSAAALASVSYAGGNAMIDLGQGVVITLQQIGAGLTLDQFVIA